MKSGVTRSIYGNATVMVDVYDNPRLDFLGAQPCFNMEPTKRQIDAGHWCERTRHSIQESMTLTLTLTLTLILTIPALTLTLTLTLGESRC